MKDNNFQFLAKIFLLNAINHTVVFYSIQHQNKYSNLATAIPNKLPIAFPKIPTVNPGKISDLFPMDLATAGTNGGLIMAAVEVIIVVVLSILKRIQNSRWISTQPVSIEITSIKAASS